MPVVSRLSPHLIPGYRQWHTAGTVLPTGYDAYQLGVAFLKANCSLDEEEVNQCSRLFVSHVLQKGYSVSDFHRHASDPLTRGQTDRFRNLCEKKCADETMPLQYLLGNWGFCGLEFECRRPVLIPRPETEELVELVRTHAQHLQTQARGQAPGLQQAFRVLDVGCGTGAIGIALLGSPTDNCGTDYNGEPNFANSELAEHWRVTAIDINPQAVDLALLNADRLLGPSSTLRARYEVLLCPLQTFGAGVDTSVYRGQFDLVVSNPPYIPRDRLAGLDESVRGHEDLVALDGGEGDGLELAKQLIGRCASLLRPEAGVTSRPLWMELDTHQPILLHTWAASEAGRCLVEGVSVHKDFTGRPRFVCVDIRV